MKIEKNPETPSQAIVKSANQTCIVTDDLGRSITIKKLRTLDRMRLFSLVGSENSKNEQYFGYAALAFSVVNIDGDPVPQPQTILQLEALVQRLDDSGFEAIAQAVLDNFSSKEKTEQSFNDEVKN